MTRREMISGPGSRRLFLAMGKAPKDTMESFRSPPLWIHVSQAGKWLLSPREARKRAVIRILDRMKTGATAAPVVKKTSNA